MKDRHIVQWFVWTTVVVGVGLAVALRSIWPDPKAWAASLIFNLFTTALGVYFINVVLAERDEAQLRARRASSRHLRRARRRLRAMRSQRRRQEFVGTLTEWPTAMCIDVSASLIQYALLSPFSAVIEWMKLASGEMRQRGDDLTQHMLLYGRFLTPRELMLINQIRESQTSLAEEPFKGVGDDLHKSQIAYALGWIVLANRELATSLNMPSLHPRVDEFNQLLGRLRRHWNIPDVKARLRQGTLAPVVDVDAPLAYPVQPGRQADVGGTS